jgi:tetratricopeptide (TPR) repeat protein
MSAEKAVETRKNNPVNFWGTRSDGNRVEPIARPEFYPSFTLETGEKIFTIGSCFARHVEGELMRRGFQIPVRDLMKDPLFADLETSVLNNYGTPSIYNELAWAFDPAAPFVAKDHLLEVKPGKYIDLHLPPTIAPAPWDLVLARRTAIHRLMRLSADCRVAIITLGLAEVWFDTHTGYYLNDVMRPSVLRLYPGRFELHVLSFEEAFGYLERAILLLREKRRRDLRVVLSVSPVPLMATHRPMDVIVANTYSKSMLRTVAETICSKYDWIDYYPSYESVLLSDRKITWEADLIHVTEKMVEMNVGRMVDRYLPPVRSLDDLRVRLTTAGRLVAEELAAAAAETGGDYAQSFFDEFRSWSERSAPFALEHARFLFARGDNEGVIRVLSNAPAGSEPLALGLLRANAQLRLGHAADAVATLTPLIHDQLRSQPTWELLVQAYAKNNDPDGAIATTHRYLRIMGYAQSWAFLNLARAFRESDPGRAAHFYELVLEDFLDSDPWIQFEIADFLAQHRQFDAARKMLAHLKPNNADLESRVSILTALIA